jgi:D-3-phosphoglycerate dehydrogenase / 2-oxoglutarate reductase
VTSHGEQSPRQGRPVVVSGRGEFTVKVFADVPPEHDIELRSGSLATPEDVHVSTQGADAVVVDYELLSADHIAAMSDSVKIIGYSGTGLDVVDLEAARARNIAVLYLPGFATDEVAEHTVALMLAGVRRLRSADHVARTDWGEWRSIGPLRTLNGATVGLIGVGRIGSGVARRVRAFGADVVAYDPVATELPQGCCRAGSLDELLQTADVVSLQVPLTDQTRGLLGEREFKLMKRDSVLVNASRGGVIDERALVDALERGEIAGACLDVVEREPLDSAAPISRAPNTLLTPHVAWYSPAAERRSRDHTLYGVAAFVRGEPVEFGVLA